MICFLHAEFQIYSVLERERQTAASYAIFSMYFSFCHPKCGVGGNEKENTDFFKVKNIFREKPS